MGTNFVNEFQVKGDEKFNLKNYTTEYKGKITKEEGEILLQKEKDLKFTLEDASKSYNDYLVKYGKPEGGVH